MHAHTHTHTHTLQLCSIHTDQRLYKTYLTQENYNPSNLDNPHNHINITREYLSALKQHNNKNIIRMMHVPFPSDYICFFSTVLQGTALERLPGKAGASHNSPPHGPSQSSLSQNVTFSRKPPLKCHCQTGIPPLSFITVYLSYLSVSKCVFI